MAGWGREIVTLQCGHYSNFVGTHIWNIQESTFLYDENPAAVVTKEINHDVLYREGRTLSGATTYTPRLVTFDLKGSLNTLRAEGVLYDYQAKEDIQWEGDVTLHEGKQPPKNAFLSDLDAHDIHCQDTSADKPSSQDGQACSETDTMEVGNQPLEGQSTPQTSNQSAKVYRLDESIDVWSDFLHGHLHPKTVMVIKQHAHGSEVDPFGLFTKGRSLLRKRDVAEDIENRLHFFVEECDHLQGFQVLVDFYDGFGGLGSSLIESLADEHRGKGIMAVGVAPAFTTNNHTADNHRLINSVLAFQRLSEQSSLLLPLSLASVLWRKTGIPAKFPNIQYKPSLAYHTSSILASSLDTATLPYRVAEDPISLSVLTEALANMGRKVSTLSTSFPLPFPDHGYLADVLSRYTLKPPWTPLTPHTHVDSIVQPFAQSVVLRGVPANRMHVPGRQPENALESCRSVNEMLKCYLTGINPRTLSSGLCINQPLKTAAPFPHIFDPRVSQEGLLQDWQRKEEEAVESLPMMTSLQTSPVAQEMLSHLVKEASKVDIRKCHSYFEDGLEQDEYSEALNSLEVLAHCYEQCP